MRDRFRHIVYTLLVLIAISLMAAIPMYSSRNSGSLNYKSNVSKPVVNTGSAIFQKKVTKKDEKKAPPTTYYVYHNGGLIGSYNITHVYEGDSAVSPYIEYDGDGISIKTTNCYTVISHKAGDRTMYETYDSGIEILSKKIP